MIADYHDITGIPPRSWDELLRDLGKPRDVVKALAQNKQYRVWLAMFGIMAVCILEMINNPVFFGYAFWAGFFRRWIYIFYCYILFAPGIITALVWFRRQGRKRSVSLSSPCPAGSPAGLYWRSAFVLLVLLLES